MIEATESSYNSPEYQQGNGKDSTALQRGRLGVVLLLRMHTTNNGLKHGFGNSMQAVDQKRDYHLEWPILE